MNIQMKQLTGMTFAAKGASKHWVMLDGPEKFGGADAASRPMEFFLFGLAGCAGADITSILQKKRVRLDSFEVYIEAERAETHPKVFTKIHIRFVFTGKGIKAKDVERSIELTRTTYCPAWTMLQEIAELTYSYEIQQSEE